ncbi:MAG: HEPN domain-containing protein [Treponema sp.]|nr:HEPN domain-containing protein [Treponema sp.]
MDRAEELNQWLKLPADNLRTAEYIAENMHPVPLEIVCNLCQQAAEKYLKCFLFFNNVDFPKIHDLPVLLNDCIGISKDFADLIKKCGFLTQYAVMPRYPNDLQITDDDVKNAIKFANDIKCFVLNKIK